MRCPRCGTENDADATLCSGCSFELDNDFVRDLAKEAQAARTARILRVITYAGAAATSGMSYFSVLVSIPFSIVLIPVCIYMAVKAHRRKKRGLPPSPNIRAQLIILGFELVGVTLAILGSLDAAPLPDDYTMADLSHPGPQYDVTWELLQSLVDPADPDRRHLVGLSDEDRKALRQIEVDWKADLPDLLAAVQEHTALLDRLWSQTSQARETLEILATYDHIPDLSEAVPVDSETNSLPAWALKEISQLTTYHLLAATANSRPDIAVPPVCQLHLVGRRLGVHARTLIPKLVSYGVLTNAGHGLNAVVNHPGVSQQTLLYIAARCPQLTPEETDLANCFIGEYIRLTGVIETEFDATFKPGKRFPLTPRQFFKRHSTRRLFRNYTDEFIARSRGDPIPEPRSVWPSIYPDLPVHLSSDEDRPLPVYYRLWNPLGAFLSRLLVPVHEKVIAIRTSVEIRDDLFHIVLAMRLGRPYSLKARAYSDEYVIDVERRMIYSPGPDGEPFTKDDIALPINPEVLGLTAGSQRHRVLNCTE